MRRRRNREAPPPPLNQLNNLDQLSLVYDQSAKLFLEHLPGFRPIEELDPVMSRPLQLDEKTQRFVPIETWEQVLLRSGITTHDPRKREVMRLCWTRLRRISADYDIPERNDLAIYLRRDGSWLLWLYRGVNEGKGATREQVCRVAAPRQLPLPAGYEPHGDTHHEHLAEHVTAVVHNVLQHALTKAIASKNSAVTIQQRIQYAAG